MGNREGIKLTPELLKSHIAEVIYEDREVGGHRAITCHFKMDNGFVVHGTKPSTSIDPANFDEALGKEISYNNTFDQLWELEAYRAMVEKQIIDVSVKDAKINIDEYVSEREAIHEMGGFEFLEGKGQSVVFRHPKDPSRGFRVEFVRTDNQRYDERRNGEARSLVEAYLRSFMTSEDLNSELVLRLAKTCNAASGDYPWCDLSEDKRQAACDRVKKFLLDPKAEPDDSVGALYRAIVVSYL
ncbi:hypothetical protein allotria_51 [Salmonella phage allotria]|uniref:Uncharacterized protein n=1 Tax=Salmonella phage allotria TaxID=2713274 RepID=A0A6G8RLX1_9CAUD|nr:hypothetical protein HYQ31_gp051 [Salmonella phage allotria]QIO02386.1 hypothetical protein allotria_51 [Salmonella phage allotria]